MRKYTILVLVLVLTATVLTGCRSGKPVPETMAPTETLMPTIMPTEEATMPSTVIPTEDHISGTENPGTIPGDADTTMGTDETGSDAATENSGAADNNRARGRAGMAGTN